MDHREFAHSFLPNSAVLEMTYKCNHMCLFCSCPWENKNGNYQKEDELSLEEWKNCIVKLVDMGVCNFSFTGGEPLLNKNIKEIIQFVNTLVAKHTDGLNEKSAPTQFLISNGQLMNEDFLVFLKENNVNLSLSMPGLKTYHQHTQNGEAAKILSLLEMAKNLGINTTVNITATKINLSELYETISKALLAGANTLLLNRFLPGGRGMEYTQELFLNSEETVEILDIAEEVLKRANRFGNVGTELPLCILKNKKYNNLKVGTRCAAAIGFFVVGPEGKIRTCNHSPNKLAHFTEIEQVKNSSYWRKFTQKDYLPVNCKQCTQTNQCDGGCREAAHVFSESPSDDDPIFILK